MDGVKNRDRDENGFSVGVRVVAKDGVRSGVRGKSWRGLGAKIRQVQERGQR